MPDPEHPGRPDLVAGLLAILIPGAGHFKRGERDRAVRIAAGVLGLFFFGIFVGGIDVVDRREDRMWFMAQAAVGPLAFGVDWIHQTHFKGVDPDSGRRRSPGPHETIDRSGSIVQAPPGGRPPSMKSVAKVNELGTLFCAVAGMLNVIVFIDAAFPGRPKRRQPTSAPITSGDLSIEAALMHGAAALGEKLTP